LHLNYKDLEKNNLSFYIEKIKNTRFI